MKRVPGSKALVSAVVREAEIVEHWRGEARRAYDRGSAGAGYCLEAAAYSNSEHAFRLARELRDLGAFA